MAHPFLEQYPKMNKFLFIDIHCISKRLLPLLPNAPQTPPAPGEIDPSVRDFLTGFFHDYERADEEDFFFMRRGGLPCPDEATADYLYFRTSLVDKNGCPIWIRASLNRSPEKSRWYAESFVPYKAPFRYRASPAQPAPYVPPRQPKIPDVHHAGFSLISPKEEPPSGDWIPLREEPVQPDTATAEAEAEPSSLTLRYPAFSSLVFLDVRKIIEQLFPLAADQALTIHKVISALEEQYKSKGEAVCRFTLRDQPATADTADALYFTTGYATPDGRDIYLECKRNQNTHREPWYGRFFRTAIRPELQEMALLKKLRIFDSHAIYLKNLSPWGMGTASTAKERIAHIAERFEEKREIFFFKDCACVANEADADQMIVPTGFFSQTGEEFMLRCKRNKVPNREPWVSRRFFLPSENAFQGRRVGKWLTSWAAFPGAAPYDLTQALFLLRDMAMPEQWSSNGRDDLAILRSYLTYTFVRLWREDKVLENKEAGSAAFNTGLVDSAYRYIYALFTQTDPAATGGRKWLFSAFCVSGEGDGGRELAQHFDPLPRPARYFDSRYPICFCFNKPCSTADQTFYYSSEHILLDRIQRLPVPFLRECTSMMDGMEEMLDELEGEHDLALRHQIWVNVRKRIQEDSRAYRAMCTRLADAVEAAIRRGAWNYHTTVPYYDPSKDKVYLLLPIVLTGNPHKPDLIMTVEPIIKSGKALRYIGHTVTNMIMAYTYSRLIAPPDSSWLNIEAISITADPAEDEEDPDAPA